MPDASTPPRSLLPLSPAIFAILLSLAGGQRHGYAIMKEAAQPDGGGISLGPGTLYGALDRMIRTGLVEETGLTDDVRRRYYRLTALGSQVLSAEVARLRTALHAAARKGIAEEVSS